MPINAETMHSSRSPRVDRRPSALAASNRAALVQVMRQAAERLFASMSLSASYAGSFSMNDMVWSDPVAILPFTGADVAGSLILTAPVELISALSPSGEQDLDALIDWSRELANLLVGSLKNTLLSQGIRIELGIPTSVIGEAVRVGAPRESALGLLFEHRGQLLTHSLHLALDVYVSEDVKISCPGESPPELDCMMF